MFFLLAKCIIFVIAVYLNIKEGREKMAKLTLEKYHVYDIVRYADLIIKEMTDKEIEELPDDLRYHFNLMKYYNYLKPFGETEDEEPYFKNQPSKNEALPKVLQIADLFKLRNSLENKYGISSYARLGNDLLVDFMSQLNPKIAESLLPSTYHHAFTSSILKLFNEYDPFDFKNKKKGYGQVDESCFYLESKELNYKTADFNPVFSELHRLYSMPDTPSDIKSKVFDLIRDGKVFYPDPVPDTALVGLCLPGKNLAYYRSGNSLMDLYKIGNNEESYTLVFKALDNGLVIGLHKEAKEHGEKKCRRITNGAEERLGIARGPIIIAAVDEKNNIIEINKEQKNFINKYYQKAHYFKDNNAIPVDPIRAQFILSKIVADMASNEADYRTLLAIGMSEKEIKEFQVMSLIHRVPKGCNI